MRSISGADFTITEAEIKEAIAGIAKYILDMYPNGCTICGILQGAVPLLRALEPLVKANPRTKHLYNVVTVGAASYKGEKQEDMVGLYDVPSRYYFEKKNVIIVDDIIDSGKTAKAVGKILMRNLKSNHIRVAALCVKGETLPEWLDVEAVGFLLPKEQFVVGFGMDYNQKFRELNEIRPLRDEERAEKVEQGVGTEETEEEKEVPRESAKTADVAEEAVAAI